MPTGAGRYQDGENAANLAKAMKDIDDLREQLSLDGPFDNRIKRLELWRSWILGVGGALMFVAGILASNAWGPLKALLQRVP